MGYSTGDNPSATGARVGKYLKKIPKSTPAYKEHTFNKVKYRILPKVIKRIEKKHKHLDNHNRENMKKWGEVDFMGNMVDWQTRIGDILVEGSLGVNKTLRALKSGKKKALEGKVKSNNQGTKWLLKKLFRSKQKSYKKHILGEE